MKVLALHFTKPSCSEASVLANLVKHLDPDIHLKLVVNQRGSVDRASFFDALAATRRIELCPVDIGLPIDPQAPRSGPARAVARLHHGLRRELVVRLAREYAPHLVYTSQQKFDCRVGELVSQRLRVPQVVHLHYTPGAWLGKNAMTRLRTCERVIAVSRYIGQLAVDNGVPSSRVVVIPNTIEVSGQSPKRADDGTRGLVIGQIGRLVAGKGFEDSVRAFAQVRARAPSAELVFVGEGSERARIEGMVAALGLSDAVRFTGWQSDVRRWLETFDVFISPSRGEPFGLVALEAAAAGVPVVGYDEGGVAEIVVDGETGLLVGPADVDSLANALLRLCSDRELRAKFGRAARARALRTFSPVDAARTFADVLQQSVEAYRNDHGARAQHGP